MPAAWYAIHSQPHKEDQLAKQLHAYNIEVFYPNISVIPVNPRSKNTRPFFPGYMFIRSDLKSTGITTFQRMPYATGLVEFGGEPAEVPDTLIAALQKHMINYQDTEKPAGVEFQSNEVVSIDNGILQGYEAIFNKHISGSDRVKVLIKILNNRFLPVEIERKSVHKRTARS